LRIVRAACWRMLRVAALRASVGATAHSRCRRRARASCRPAAHCMRARVLCVRAVPGAVPGVLRRAPRGRARRARAADVLRAHGRLHALPRPSDTQTRALQHEHTHTHARTHAHAPTNAHAHTRGHIHAGHGEGWQRCVARNLYSGMQLDATLIVACTRRSCGLPLRNLQPHEQRCAASRSAWVCPPPSHCAAAATPCRAVPCRAAASGGRSGNRSGWCHSCAGPVPLPPRCFARQVGNPVGREHSEGTGRGQR
jgi:hypothetical protein